ncbi:hypothetical protein GGR55DRAFT_695405 [Xylaria sp. FL0064]|nr:hypothetical protein GGR55DRAFT_695405 [Xylaria sp. FL0064]
MAEGKPGTGDDAFPSSRPDSPPTTPPGHAEPRDELLVSKPARTFTPRGQRFSKLSDAYLNITSRLPPNKASQKASEQSKSNPAGAAPSPVARPRLAKSQDDLQTSGSALAMRAFMNRRSRCASFDSIDLPEDLQSGTGSSDNNSAASLSRKIDHELSKFDAVSYDNTTSTIERIVAQYDNRIPSLQVEYDNTREYRAKAELPVSQPPTESLPESPPTNMRPTSNVRQQEYDSPVPDSSIIDSQHLLDAEAQARELEQARRAVVPKPLNIVRARRDLEILSRQHHAAIDDDGSGMTYEEEFCAANPFAHPDDECSETYWQFPMERDVSQELRRFSGYDEHNATQTYRANAKDHRQAQPKGKNLYQPSLPTIDTGERPMRHIKVVIGRDSDSGKNSQVIPDGQADEKKDVRDLVSEDGDWVTEATSDVGFGFSAGALPGRALTGGLKKTGSSLADYSDDSHEDVLDRFGSCERIIQHSAGDEQYQPYDIERPDAPKFADFLSRRQNAYPQGSGLRWASATEEETGQFRPLPKNRHPYREIGSLRPKNSGRLAFNFDGNAPPRYAFRDSVSEYEPAVASTMANCGTNQYDTRGSLPSTAADFGEEDHHTATDGRFDQPGDFDVDENHSGSLTEHQEPSVIDPREFAAASSYFEPPSANSVTSQFDFELLPLELAQKKEKLQRDKGKTKETGSTTARLRRKRSFRSSEAGTNSIEPPHRDIIVSSDLSVNFSSPEWKAQSSDLGDPPTPFSMGRSQRTTSGTGSRYRNLNPPGAADISSPYTTRSVKRRRRYSVTDYGVVPTLHPRPFFVAPDDYVSDSASATRRSIFYILAVLSILPFFGVLVLSGAFSGCLKWATQCEVDRLTPRQRYFIKVMLYVETILYTGGVVAVVVYFVMRAKAQQY